MKNKITDKLFELAYTDSMTELQNRNAYGERLKKLRKPSSNISRTNTYIHFFLGVSITLFCYVLKSLFIFTLPP